MEFVSPTVGLMALAGCLTFLVTPEEGPRDPRVAAALASSHLPLVIIDPGHGGRDVGAQGNGLTEKDLTLDVSLRLNEKLQSLGFKTVMTRQGDSFLSLAERTQLANQHEHSLFVSVHFNKAASTAASGIETFYATEKIIPEAPWSFAGFFTEREPLRTADNGENLAGYVQASLLNRTEAGNRGIKPKALYVVRHTRAPAVLIEAGFLSNPFEAKLIATPAYRERLAGAIAEGVAEYAKTMPPPAKRPTQLAKASP